MSKPPNARSDRFEIQPDLDRTDVTIQKVVVYYNAPDQNGDLADFLVEIDPKKADAVVWNPKALEEFKKDKTKHNDPPKKPGELPDPVPNNRKLEKKLHDKREVPEGTCCFINGRWICWD